MGLIGNLLKGIGKVAKVGLGIATHGVSDKLLAVGKNLGKLKKSFRGARQRAGILTGQEEALINKVGKVAPQVRKAQILRDAMAGEGAYGIYARAATATGRRKRRRRAQRREAPAPARRARGRRKAGVARAVRRANGKRRGPPRGGLDLRAMAGEWRAAGKPGSWRDWIRNNPLKT